MAWYGAADRGSTSAGVAAARSRAVRNGPSGWLRAALVLLVLLGNSAWVLEAHAEVFVGHAVAADDAGSGPGPLPSGIDACDHCCHAQSHCLALVPSSLDLRFGERTECPLPGAVPGENRDRDPPPLPPCI
jgi:hypothetical protein